MLKLKFKPNGSSRWIVVPSVQPGAVGSISNGERVIVFGCSTTEAFVWEIDPDDCVDLGSTRMIISKSSIGVHWQKDLTDGEPFELEIAAPFGLGTLFLQHVIEPASTLH